MKLKVTTKETQLGKALKNFTMKEMFLSKLGFLEVITKWWIKKERKKYGDDWGCP